MLFVILKVSSPGTTALTTGTPRSGSVKSTITALLIPTPFKFLSIKFMSSSISSLLKVLISLKLIFSFDGYELPCPLIVGVVFAVINFS